MTSLDASGFSITLLKATPEILAAIDAPTSAIGWPQTASNFQPYTGKQVLEGAAAAAEHGGARKAISSGPTVNGDVFTQAVTRACHALLAAEPQITHNDRIVGDGDCGATLSRGANAVLETLSHAPLGASAYAAEAVLRIAGAVETSMDGTSGALYELFFTALGSAVQGLPAGEMDVSAWAAAAADALQRLQKMTPARVGDRTVMDALAPYIETLGEAKSADAAVDAARKGRDATKGMEASLGRAVYVAGENWSKVPDPGAEGIVAIVEGLAGN